MKKLINNSIPFLIFVIWATFVLGQDFQAPLNVDITNDGINPVHITDVGPNKALDVNVVQTVSTGSSGGTTTTFVSGGTLTVTGTVDANITNPTVTVHVDNPTTSVTTSASGVTPISGNVTVDNPVTSVTTSALGNTPVTETNPVTSMTTSALGTTPISGAVDVNSMPVVTVNVASTPTTTTPVTQATTTWNVGGTVTIANPTTTVAVYAADHICSENSTTATLGSNATFTGTFVSTMGSAAMSILVSSDVASAASGLHIQFSSDGVNIDDEQLMSFTDTTNGQSYGATCRGPYARIIYTNGATPQSVFRLQSYGHIMAPTGDIIDVNFNITGAKHAMLTKSMIVGHSTDPTGYEDVKVNPAGAMTVDASGTNLNVLPAIANANPSVKTEGTQGVVSTDLNGNLRTRSYSESILGDTVVQPRINQVEVNFSEAFDATILTNSTSGTGTALQSNGGAAYSSGTATTADSSGVSVQSILYRPGHESFVYFTAAWTSPTSTDSFQRIGAMDAAFASALNGFYMGYEGLNMKASFRQNGVDTHQAFNGDLLDSNSTSVFTRAGVIEAIDYTKLNVFRIRWSWFGAAPVVWQILSPDGNWVTFHSYRNPNTQLLPSIFQPNLFVAISVNKSLSDATDLKMTTSCWAAGTTDDQIKITDSVVDTSLAKLVRSVIVGHTTAGGGGYVNVKVTATGAMKIDPTGATTQPVSTTVVSNLAHAQITVTNVATLIRASNAARVSLIIRNQGAANMYVGGSGVTTANGILVNINDTLILDRTTAAVYGIVSAASTTAAYLEE